MTLRIVQGICDMFGGNLCRLFSPWWRLEQRLVLKEAKKTP